MANQQPPMLPSPTYAALPVMQRDATQAFGPAQFAQVQYPSLQSIPGISGYSGPPGAGGPGGYGPPPMGPGGGMLGNMPPSKQAIPNVQGAVEQMPRDLGARNHGWWAPWSFDPSVTSVDPYHWKGSNITGTANVGMYRPEFWVGMGPTASAPIQGNTLPTTPAGGFDTPPVNFGGGSPGGIF